MILLIVLYIYSMVWSRFMGDRASARVIVASFLSVSIFIYTDRGCAAAV